MWGGVICRPLSQLRPETGKYLAKYPIINKSLYIVILLLLSRSQKMEDHQVDPINHDIYTHDEYNNYSKISIKTEF